MSEPPTTEEILGQPSDMDQLPVDPVLDEIHDRMHYDKEGRPISLREWCKLFHRDDYKVIAQETVGRYWVSTVWLGIDHNFMPGSPLAIFESMVFANEPSWHPGFVFKGMKIEGRWSREDFAQRRYSTLEQAKAGHAELVNEVRLFLDLHPPEEG